LSAEDVIVAKYREIEKLGIWDLGGLEIGRDE